MTHLSLYHRAGFVCGDPAAWIRKPDGTSIFLARDIELVRARDEARADACAAPAAFAPEGGLSGDRMTATAQAAAECLRQSGAKTVTVDRSLPYAFAYHCEQAGLELIYDADLGVSERRAKTQEEIALLGKVQAITESVMARACGMIAGAKADKAGVLQVDGAPLTSERVRAMVTGAFAEADCSMPHGAIAAGVPHCSDCHHRGEGVLTTGTPVIIDLFPMHDTSRYFGDCTRTVVHGTPSDEVTRMHAAVVAAKAAATKACVIGATGQAVHDATRATLGEHGYEALATAPEEPSAEPVMVHGTGHGLGLEVHEPILLADGVGTPIVNGEALTIEPGLYSTTHGGVRVEDLIIVTDEGVLNLNRLSEGLDWA